MATTETVVARFEAQIIDFTKKMKEMADSSERAAERVRRGHDKASDDVAKAWKKSGFDDAMKRNIGAADSLRSTLLKVAPALAAAFSVKEAVAAADTYTRFTNSLRVAGLEGKNLTDVQEGLYASAQKNGIALEPLSQLYGRASQSAKELGASQADLLKFTNGVTAGLRVQGGSMEEASGALTQLSQLLSGGVVHAEEFNSVNEGARPILEAVAAGNEKYGGSVAKLRAEMLKGKLTSAEFFSDFLAGSSMLEAKAAKAPLTVSASWQALENALVRGIGQLNESTGATEALSGALVWLSNNLDDVSEALGVLAGILGGAIVANGAKSITTFVAATAAQRAMTTSAAAAAVASEGLAAALAMVGGPWGLAIIAIGAAIGFLAVKALGAKKETTSYAEAMATANDLLDRTPAAAGEAGKAIESQKDAAIRSRKEAEKLTGKLGDLAVAYLEAANAAKAFEINSLMAARAKNGEALDDARKHPLPGGAHTAYGQKLRVENLEQNDRDYEAKILAASAKGPTEGEYGKAGEAAVKALKDRNAAAAGKGKKGRSAADIARSDDAALAQATQEELAVRLSMAKTEEDRHALALQMLELEHQNRLQAIDDDKNTSATAKEKLKTLENTTYANKVLAEGVASLETQQAEERDARDKRLEALRADTDAQQRLAELNEDLLTWQARNAKTSADRARFEAAALASKQKRELDQIDAEIALAKATNDAATALRLTAQRGVIVQRQGEETKDQTEQGNRTVGDWGQWAKDKTTGVFDPAEINKSLQDIADNGIANLTDGITDAIMGAKSLGDAFKEVAKSIIADLIRIAIKMLIFKALGTLFPGFGNVATAAMSVGRNAAGTDSWKGGPTTLNENGQEAYLLPQGSQVAPAGLLRSALSGMARGGGGRSGGTVINNHTTVNANDAVLTGWVQQQIYQANMQSLQMSRQLSAKDSTRSSRNRL